MGARVQARRIAPQDRHPALVRRRRAGRSLCFSGLLGEHPAAPQLSLAACHGSTAFWGRPHNGVSPLCKITPEASPPRRSHLTARSNSALGLSPVRNTGEAPVMSSPVPVPVATAPPRARVSQPSRDGPVSTLGRIGRAGAGPATIAFVRICAHFFNNGAWLEVDQLLRNVYKPAGIPAVLVHGRHDMGSRRYRRRGLWRRRGPARGSASSRTRGMRTPAAAALRRGRARVRAGPARVGVPPALPGGACFRHASAGWGPGRRAPVVAAAWRCATSASATGATALVVSMWPMPGTAIR